MIEDLSDLTTCERRVSSDVITRRIDSRIDESPATAELLPGAVLTHRYVIEGRLGRGGMGTVYQAVDRIRRANPEIDCHVAIKVLHEATRWRPEALARLSREFYCAQALSHRSVVKVFELDRDDDFAFFTMELLDGELLSEVIKRSLPAAVDRPLAWSVIREIGDGIAHAHSRNVIHADLKPQNIMVTKSGETRILDFGASSDSIRSPAGDSANDACDSAAVTPAYAAWELLDGQQADPRDDLFALACVSYELLAGRHPFGHRRSPEARQLGLRPARPPGLTRRQWQALSLGLQWDRENRSMSVRDWLAALDPAGPAAKQPYATAAALAAAFAIIASGWLGMHRTVNTQQSVERSGGLEASASALTSASALASASAPAAAPAVVDRPAKSAQFVPPVKATPPVADPAPAQRPHLKPPSAPAIGIAAAAYRMRADKNFAEIHVRRNSGLSGSASFEWWTEPGSAVAGRDFVPQIRTTTTFLPGRLTASLFVKLVPNPARREARMFYVVIADPSGRSSPEVSKASISLLPAR